MVVNDIENHREAMRVGGIHQGAQVIGLPIDARRGVEAHAIVTPVALARKIGQRHELDAR
jgi:hypothetical protein